MFETIRDEFDERTDDIDIAFEHLKEVRKVLDSGKEVSDKLNLSEHLFNVLSATVDLIVYNQVEATSVAFVEAIYDHLEDKSIEFSDLNYDFQEKVLSDLMATTSAKKLYSFLKENKKSFAQGVTKSSFNGNTIFNGNVDFRKLKLVCKAYNLELIPPQDANNGSDLKEIKKIRNDLAHGSISFAKQGASTTISDIENRIRCSRSLMKAVIDQVEGYLLSEQYLDRLNVA